MRRLVPFLIAAIMASFPSSFFLLLIGPLIINSGGISCTSANHCNNHGGGALTGVSAVMAYTATPSRTMTSTAAVMMASSSLSSSSSFTGGGLSGASATEVNFNMVQISATSEPVNRISNHGELSLGDNQRLKVEVLGGSPHCTFSMVEFTNTVSLIGD